MKKQVVPPWIPKDRWEEPARDLVSFEDSTDAD